MRVNTNKAESDFLSVTDVALQLGLSRQKTYNLLNDGDLKVHLFGGTRRISKLDLKDFIKNSKKNKSEVTNGKGK